MKKNLLFIAVLSLVVFACGPIATTDTAIDYNDEMIAIQKKADDALVELYDEILMGDEESVMEAKVETMKILDECEKEVKEKDDFDGKDDFKKAMLDLLSVFKDITENEFAEYIDFYYYMDDTELTDDEWDYYYDLIDVAMDKYDEAYDDFSDFQDGFAKEWDFVLE